MRNRKMMMTTTKMAIFQNTNWMYGWLNLNQKVDQESTDNLIKINKRAFFSQDDDDDDEEGDLSKYDLIPSDEEEDKKEAKKESSRSGSSRSRSSSRSSSSSSRSRSR